MAQKDNYKVLEDSGLLSKDCIKKRFAAVGATILLLFFISSCNPNKEKMYKETRIALYTVVTVTVYSDSKQKANTAIDSTFKELDRLGRLLNFYAEDSEVSMINRYAGINPVKVSKETLEVIDKALSISRSTDGAFDITIGAIVKLWDFEKQILPDDKSIKEKLKLVGYKNVIVDKARSTVFLQKKGMQIDLGGIEKGYATDRAVNVLKQNGITAGIIAVGGEVKPFGIKPDGEPWRVGIKNPHQKGKEDEVFAVVNLTGKAISTSGGYEKSFVKDGRWYHHILNPATGYPVYECQSVSVIANDAPDGFPTGIFVLGPQKGMQVLKKLGLDGVIMDKKGDVFVTEGIKDKVQYIHNEP
ncbi:MAG TPA: FAD:protein FMN transferase [Syntrophales bacterium]|nr:FAD:protein FMN transferase [Syntrophales bacterium]